MPSSCLLLPAGVVTGCLVLALVLLGAWVMHRREKRLSLQLEEQRAAAAAAGGGLTPGAAAFAELAARTAAMPAVPARLPTAPSCTLLRPATEFEYVDDDGDCPDLPPHLPKIPVLVLLPDRTSMSFGWQLEQQQRKEEQHPAAACGAHPTHGNCCKPACACAGAGSAAATPAAATGVGSSDEAAGVLNAPAAGPGPVKRPVIRREWRGGVGACAWWGCARASRGVGCWGEAETTAPAAAAALRVSTWCPRTRPAACLPECLPVPSTLLPTTTTPSTPSNSFIVPICRPPTALLHRGA